VLVNYVCFEPKCFDLMENLHHLSDASELGWYGRDMISQLDTQRTDSFIPCLYLLFMIISYLIVSTNPWLYFAEC